MEGKADAWVTLLAELFGGTVALLAIVGALAIVFAAWMFRRLWMLVRIEILIESRKTELNQLSEKAQSLNSECDSLHNQRRALLRGMPPEVPKVVPMDRGKTG
jgi:hypothetical protein